MKNSITIGLLCLLIGIAIGWIAKPIPENPIASTNAPNGSSRPGTRVSSSPQDGPAPQKSDRPDVQTRTVVARNHKPTEEQPQQMEKFQEQRDKKMVDSQRKKFERRISDLVTKLGLDAQQEASLRAFFEKKLEDMTGISGGMENLSDLEGMKSIAALLSEDGLDEAMTDILSDDQLATFEEAKAADRSRKMDTRALKDLSKITGLLELSPDQKDSVYEILYDQAGDKIDNPSPITALMSLQMGAMGMDIDYEDTGLMDMVEMQMTQAGASGSEPNKEVMMKAYKEKAAKRVDDKVSLLSDVLTEDQTARYREHLEEKNSSLFGGAFFGTTETSETTVIPPEEE